MDMRQRGSDHTQEPRDRGLILSLNPKAKVHSLVKGNILITQNKAYAFFEGNIFQTEYNVHAWVRWRATQWPDERYELASCWSGLEHCILGNLCWTGAPGTQHGDAGWALPGMGTRSGYRHSTGTLVATRAVGQEETLNGVSLSPPLLPPQRPMWLTSFLISSSSGFSSGASAWSKRDANQMLAHGPQPPLEVREKAPACLCHLPPCGCNKEVREQSPSQGENRADAK